MRRGSRGLLVAEALTALIMIAAMTALLFGAIVSYVRSRNDFMLERTLRLAAEAQIERCRAGASLDAAIPPGLLPADVRLTAKSEPGHGVWQGLTRVSVTATGAVGGRAQTVTVSGYLAEAPQP